MEGAQKVLRRQKHVLSQSTTPFPCTLGKMRISPEGRRHTTDRAILKNTKSVSVT